jgi:hypothetical protein
MEREGGRLRVTRTAGEVVFAVAKIMLEVVTLGLQDIEAAVLDLPSGAAGGGDFDDIIGVGLRATGEPWDLLGTPPRTEAPALIGHAPNTAPGR